MLQNQWLDSCDQTYARRHCEHCGRGTIHRIVANGGTRLRCYIHDYSGRDFSGDLRHFGLSAEYADGTPVTEQDGTRTDAKINHDFEARRKDRLDRKQSDRKRRDGRQSLFFDQKG